MHRSYDDHCTGRAGRVIEALIRAGALISVSAFVLAGSDSRAVERRADERAGAPGSVAGRNFSGRQAGAEAGPAEVPPTDADGDGYAAPLDCQDRDPAVNPGAVDACNGLDDDCDGTLDAGCSCIAPGIGAGPQVLHSTYEPSRFRTAWSGVAGYVSAPFINATALQRVDRFGRVLFEPPPINLLLAEDIAFAGDGLGVVSTVDFVATDRQGIAAGPWSSFCTTEPEHDCAGPARIAWASDRFGIAWFRTGPASDPLQFRTVDRSGDPISLPLSPALPRGDRLEIAASADAFGVVFGDSRNLHLWTVDRADAATHGPTELFHSDATDGQSTPPAVVWNGDSFGVAWAFQATGERALYFREASPGAVAGPLRTVLSLPSEVNVLGGSDLKLTWAADRYAVTYYGDDGWIHLVTFDRSGNYIADAAMSGWMLKAYSLGLEWNGGGFVWLVQDDAWNREVMAYAVGDSCTVDGDGDGWWDCVDGDDADSGVWTPAGEVRQLDVSRQADDAVLSWTGEWANGGGPETFDIVDQPAGLLRQENGFGSAACAASGLTGASWTDDRVGPDPGEARAYLVRPSNGLGPGTYGESGAFPDPRDALDGASPCP